MWVIISVALTVVLIATGAFLFQRHRADVAEAHRQQVAHQKELAREKREAAQLAKEQREAAAAERRAAQAEYDGCVDEVSPFMDDLSTVDARLDVGVQESEFSDLVGQASVSYNRIDTDELQGGCLSAAAMLETALQKYIGTASKWNDCLWDSDYCTTDDIEYQMQRSWSQASTLIDRASKKLEAVDPSNGDET